MAVRLWTMVFGLVVGIGWGCSHQPAAVPPTILTEGVEFRVIFPNASSVAVAGSFNGWSSTKHLCVRLGKGEWKVFIPMSSGEYHFMYVIDGEEWVTPPLAEDFVSDGFGQENGVVNVP